jgi:DNA helicase-2/ATP-dependent DNA helicase PcrA
LSRITWTEQEFAKRNIPFIVFGEIKFTERRHIKDILSFFKIILNPLDAIAWHRILRLIEGVGKIRSSDIVKVIQQNNGVIYFHIFKKKKFYIQLLTLEDLYHRLLTNNLNPSEMMIKILEYYNPILKEIEDNYKIRLKDLETLQVIISKYQDIEKFLSDFALEPPSNQFQDKVLPSPDEDEKAVVISTIHSAKGLEWYTVFIPFALDGLIPSHRSLKTIQEVEEERRLFYVACSRAKEHLFITMPAYVSSWNAIFTKPTRFLAEIRNEYYTIEK